MFLDYVGPLPILLLEERETVVQQEGGVDLVVIPGGQLSTHDEQDGTLLLATLHETPEQHCRIFVVLLQVDLVVDQGVATEELPSLSLHHTELQGLEAFVLIDLEVEELDVLVDALGQVPHDDADAAHHEVPDVLDGLQGRVILVEGTLFEVRLIV